MVPIIHGVVEEAFWLYAENHVLSEADAKEVRHDFARFYVAALQAGHRGIRWNFNGCIMCPEQDEGGAALLCRVLVGGPRIAAATMGRALGTVACREHVGQFEGQATEAAINAALRRIQAQPPPEAP